MSDNFVVLSHNFALNSVNQFKVCVIEKFAEYYEHAIYRDFFHLYKLKISLENF